MPQKTCFVIIGYGVKTDHLTGREINLDKTYINIIKPAFTELGFLCYRASDITHAGVIDIPMYENILKADFVVADLTTLNANVLYELGVRHAVRRNTTMIISDAQLSFPFDLSHILIDKYEHLGRAIDYEEVLRFQEVLKSKAKELMENPKTDSPIYTIFPDLQMPSFSKEEVNDIKESMRQEESLSLLVEEAERAKDNEDYEKAIALLNAALTIAPNSVFVTQRLALATYKRKKPNPHEALVAALGILETLSPLQTTDLETLGLSGAIHKRLYDITNDAQHLEKALWFYKKGFYIAEDYYNGVNVAYLLTIQAAVEKDRLTALASYGEARSIRRRLFKICQSLIEGKIWDERDDKQWILLTMAEAYYGEGQLHEAENAVEHAKPYLKGSFSMATFLEQQSKLREALETFQAKYSAII